jgi:hypothetical protein
MEEFIHEIRIIVNVRRECDVLQFGADEGPTP